MKTKMFLVNLCIVLVLASCTTAAKPIPTSIPLDSNRDGMITPEELKVTFSTMHEIVKQIAETRPAEAATFEAQITSFEDGFPINLDIGRISQTAYEILSVVQTINDEQAVQEKTSKNLMTGVYIFIVIAAAVLLLVIFLFVRRRRSNETQTDGNSIRSVFFSFENGDFSRAAVVRESWITERKEAVGFIDTEDFEELIKQGEAVVKAWIDEQLEETSVTVVLVGKDTCNSEWVKYAVEKSMQNNKGLLGIDVSKIKDLQGKKSERCGKIPEGYPFYLWNKDDGKENIGRWIETAAKVAGR
ncbi:MAG: hypothetical protein FD147_2200 [Chloroflexi bacterium]|nr:MAG: hypothetical protein FD147_2200 [Chloroflexota bacterium]